MKKRVQSLNTAGTEIFVAWLKDPKEPAPKELLDDPKYCDDIEKDFFIDSERMFDTTFELGKYLHDEVFNEVCDFVSLEASTGMWSWLSLAFISSLLSRSSSRKGKPLDFRHYIQPLGQDGRRKGYRLIVRTAWRLVRLHGAHAEIALGSTRSPWGEMAEQMTSRQEIFSHPSFWAVAFRLYRSPKGDLRRGATSQRPEAAKKDPQNNAGKGGVRRLPFTFRQFDRTYLTRAMSLEQMLEVLPTEYQRWVAKS